jgi:hypothetical protein
MRKAIWIVGMGALLFTGTALADGAAPPPKSHAKYGSAGCGLGSMIIANNGIIQIFAATTNGTSANQTFAITSGTSNCDDSGTGLASTRVFVEANRVALAKDISRGSGETIDDLAVLAGCGDSKAVGATLQHSFKTIFPDASVSSDKVTDSILTTLKSDASLACTAVDG